LHGGTSAGARQPYPTFRGSFSTTEEKIPCTKDITYPNELPPIASP
jgi:hypothetical protein